MTSKDRVFKEEIKTINDFKFGASVANVFDDMINRSVPFYGEIQRMMAEQAADYAKAETDVYDLGCATGTTLINMNNTIAENIRFIGVDDSPEMLAKCRNRLNEAGFRRPVELRIADINNSVNICNASVVVLCLTLQFVRPIYREHLLRNIHTGLINGGILILVEKILTENSAFNRDFINYYYNYKRRSHYSELEITQKREALENVLIPYKLSENTSLLRDTGFSQYEVFFQWYNFSGLIALKN